MRASWNWELQLLKSSQCAQRAREGERERARLRDNNKIDICTDTSRRRQTHSDTHTHTRSGLCKAQAGVSQTRSQRWQRSGNGSGRRQLGAARKCKLAEANWRRRTVASSQATRERVRSGTEHEKRAPRYEIRDTRKQPELPSSVAEQRQSTIVNRQSPPSVNSNKYI